LLAEADNFVQQQKTRDTLGAEKLNSDYTGISDIDHAHKTTVQSTKHDSRSPRNKHKSSQGRKSSLDNKGLQNGNSWHASNISQDDKSMHKSKVSQNDSGSLGQKHSEISGTCLEEDEDRDADLFADEDEDILFREEEKLFNQIRQTRQAHCAHSNHSSHHKLNRNRNAKDDSSSCERCEKVCKSAEKNNVGSILEASPVQPPVSNSFEPEYLGPAPSQERKDRSHPIFLMPEKPKIGKEAGSDKPPRPQRPFSAKVRGRDSRRDEEEREGQGLADFEIEGNAPSRSGRKGQGQGHVEVTSPYQEYSRYQREGRTRPKSAVDGQGRSPHIHIREDRNVTVDITPRNLGRKVATLSKGQRRGQGQGESDPTGIHVKNAWSQDMDDADRDRGRGRPGVGFEPEQDSTHASSTFTSHHRAQTPATIAVQYDDDDDNKDESGEQTQSTSPSSGKKGHHRRRRCVVKENDLVTMVSEISLAENEKEDEEGLSAHSNSGTDGEEGEVKLGSSSLSKGQ
jgi:hypothetical protein